MKEKFKLILMIVLFIILILVGASLIRDFLTFIIGDKLNSVWLFIIQVILIFVFIEILFKTSPGKYLNDKLFKKKKKMMRF